MATHAAMKVFVDCDAGVDDAQGNHSLNLGFPHTLLRQTEAVHMRKRFKRCRISARAAKPRR